jgi:hypothetical protein
MASADKSADTRSVVLILAITPSPVAPVNHPDILPASKQPTPPLFTPFPTMVAPEREQAPLLENPFGTGPLSPGKPLHSPFPAETGLNFHDLAGLLPTRGLDLLIPLLPVSSRELDHAIQDLMQHLDTLLPSLHATPVGADWTPWLIVLAGTGAACEVGRRVVLDRLKDELAAGPVPIP